MAESANQGGAKPQVQAPTLRPGQVIARRYQVVQLVGRGGMGAIYRAQDNVLREAVALKTLLPQFTKEQSIVQRFFNEARIARQLSHPHIVRVHDIGMADQVLYISMEFVEGRSLRSLFEATPKGTPFPTERILEILKQLCHALDYAHRYTIHRDIKPENIMVTNAGAVKLMDFGISKLTASPGLTQTSMVMGTPQYMPPEQFQDSASVDARADLYSLGVILYEAMARTLPTGMSRPVSEINPQAPKALDDIVARCLAPNKEDRFPSAAALGSAIEAVQRAMGGTAPPRMQRRKAQNRGMPVSLFGRRVAGVVLAAVLFVAALAAGGMVLRQGPPDAARTAGVSADGMRTDEPRDIDWPRAAGAARSKARTYVGSHEEKQALFERAEDLLDAGQASQALECYLGVMLWPVDDSMVFIPPGGVIIEEGGASASFRTRGFFADREEVSTRDFALFAANTPGGWARPAYLASVAFEQIPEREPVVNIPLYYGQAFAAGYAQAFREEYEAAFSAWAETSPEAGKSVPTEAQWARMAAFTQETGAGIAAVGGSAAEWTCTRYGPLPYSTGDGRSDPRSFSFGVPAVVRGDAQSNAPYSVRRPMAWDAAANRIGFRCVKSLPESPEELLSLAEQLPDAPTD